ncbi:MAG: protein kinase [Sandaracinaceae bacterium]|nr:protein kinase [Sandaracinaceae bacterium]
MHGFGCAEGRSWLAIDWIEGVDLTAVASRPMAPALAAYIVAELAELVAALHEQILPEIAPYGLLHGDLSPRNVRLTVDGRVRLMDFGSAVPLRADGHAAQCEPGGTLRYLAPEQLAGEPAQARSEVYALGLLLDELLIGGPAFDADDELELVMAVRSGQVRLPRPDRGRRAVRARGDLPAGAERRSERAPLERARLRRGAARLPRLALGACSVRPRLRAGAGASRLGVDPVAATRADGGARDGAPLRERRPPLRR